MEASVLQRRIPPEDRVRAKTDPDINRRIDTQLQRRLKYYAVQDPQTITERIAELDREWDIERVLAANAASVGALGIILGATASRKWFVLPLVVSSFLLQHAVQGWCPPLPVFRRLGFRTQSEIERERTALKTLRGDFEGLGKRGKGSSKPNVGRVLEAAER